MNHRYHIVNVIKLQYLPLLVSLREQDNRLTHQSFVKYYVGIMFCSNTY